MVKGLADLDGIQIVEAMGVGNLLEMVGSAVEELGDSKHLRIKTLEFLYLPQCDLPEGTA